MERRGVGPLLLAVGAAIEAIGVAIEVGQEQNICAISQSVTLPTFLIMLLGIPLISRGYARCVRNTRPTGRRYAIACGSLFGSLLLVGALWWQVAIGLPSGDNLDLESYAALPLFFVGVALLAQVTASIGYGVREPEDRPESRQGAPRPADGNPSSPPTDRPWFSVPLLALGVVFLGAMAGAAGWLERQVLNVNSLYLLVVIEMGAAGTWFLLVGYSTLTRNSRRRSRPTVRVVGLVGGTALVLGGVLQWWTSFWTDWVGVVGLAAFVLSGTGLLILSTYLRGGTIPGESTASP